MVPSKENSTISIPTEYYGMEVEVLVYPNHKVWKGLTPSMKKTFKAGSNFRKFSREELYDRN
jgi:hypothetical protein